LNKIAEQPSFRKGVAGFSIATGISRLTGLVREVVMASLFGAGFAKDAFEIAFRIPNILRDFFAENALSASFVPVFAEKMGGTDRRDLWRLANNLFNTLLIVVGAFVILGVIFSPQIVSVIGHGFKSVPGKIELTTMLNRVLFPFLLFISLSAWSAGVLNAHNRFFLPAVSSALFNLGSIAVAYLSYNFWISRGLDPIMGMAVGGLVGVFFQFLIPYIAVWRKGYRYRPYVNWRSPDLWKVLKLWGPVVLGLGLVEIQVAVDTFLAVLFEQGSISWLNYAYRVMHLPLALFGAAVGTVSLTLFSRQRVEGDLAGLAASIQRSLRIISVLLIPTLLFFIAFAHPIIRVIYQRGAFTPVDTMNTAAALMLYVAGIWAASSVRTLSVAFYAFRDSRTPMFVNLASVVLNISLNLSLAFFVLQVRQFRAFAFATTFCSFFSMSVLIFLLKRKIVIWRASDHPIYGLRVFIAAALAIVPVYLAYRFYFIDRIEGFLPTLLMLGAGFIVASGLYYLIARLMGLKEIAGILKRK
jgi:putative peptidoglycan lipid II flippase